MRLRETAISGLILVGLLVLARWVYTLDGGDPPTGPFGYFSWAAYLVGGVIAFSILGSAAAGIWTLAHRALHRGEAARAARRVKTDAHFFYVDAGGGMGPYQVGKIRLVPALGLVDVEFRALSEPVSEARLNAMREVVNEAVERIKRDAQPGAWVEALPEALAGLREHEFVLRGPSGGFHWYDPPEVDGKADR